MIESDLVSIVAGLPRTTSKLIAEKFGKNHKDILRSIRELECSANFSQRNFTLTSEDIAQPKGGVRKEPIYFLTRDGFVFLAMGFTGKKAALWKEKYISAFNRLEAAALEKQKEKIRLQQSRKDLSETLLARGVQKHEFGAITNYQYTTLFGKTAKRIKDERNPEAKTARELLNRGEQGLILAQEGLILYETEIKDSHGFEEIKPVIKSASNAVRQFIARDFIAGLELMKTKNGEQNA